jgi:tetratricopeptide (TPR) repeat protein
MSSSRLLTRLEADIAAAPDTIAADCLRAERASYLARQGRFDEARGVLDELHQRYDKHPVVQVSIWLNLVEGLMSYFTDMGKLSIDKILRAHALSVAADVAPLRALCSAWLAHIQFGMLRIEEMAKSLKEAFRLVTPDQSSVIARASLVVAEALHLANRFDLASPWYAVAKNHANRIGDDATISALMHNMTGMRVAIRRQMALSGYGGREGGPLVMVSADATSNYDNQIGATSLNSLVPLLRAQVLALDDQPEAALTTYLGVMETATRQGMHRLFANILADRAWCNASLGRVDLAVADALASEASLIPDTQIDEQAATHSRLSQTYGLLGNDAQARRHGDLADGYWSEFRSIQTRLTYLLQDLPSPLRTYP